MMRQWMWIAIIAAATMLAGFGLSLAPAGWETQVHFDDGGDELTVENGGLVYVKSGGTLQFASGATITNAIGAGAVATVTGLTAAETGDGVTHRTTLTLADVSLTIADHTTAGAHGSAKLYDWPAGAIKIVSVVSDVDATCGATGLTATATFDYGLGSAALGIDNAALASTETDILAFTGTDLVASAGTLNAYTGTDLTLDGTTTAGDCYLNVAFAADDASANDACVLAGTITLTWVNAGDY